MPVVQRLPSSKKSPTPSVRLSCFETEWGLEPSVIGRDLTFVEFPIDVQNTDFERAVEGVESNSDPGFTEDNGFALDLLIATNLLDVTFGTILEQLIEETKHAQGYLELHGLPG